MSGAALALELKGRRSGHGWMANCPSHEDKRPSLSIRESNGRVLVHCFGGCGQSEVLDALRARGLWPEHQREAGQRPRKPRDPDYTGDLQRAEYWRAASLQEAETALEEMSSTDPERLTITLFAETIRQAGECTLVAVYREHRQTNPDITAGMVCAGRLHEAREQRDLAEWLMKGPNAQPAA